MEDLELAYKCRNIAKASKTNNICIDRRNLPNKKVSLFTGGRSICSGSIYSSAHISKVSEKKFIPKYCLPLRYDTISKLFSVIGLLPFGNFKMNISRQVSFLVCRECMYQTGSFWQSCFFQKICDET